MDVPMPRVDGGCVDSDCDAANSLRWGGNRRCGRSHRSAAPGAELAPRAPGDFLAMNAYFVVGVD